LIVGAVTFGILRILATTARFSTDVVLLGEAPGTHFSQRQELGFDFLDFLLD
jgi:hypothetical protein